MTQPLIQLSRCFMNVLKHWLVAYKTGSHSLAWGVLQRSLQSPSCVGQELPRSKLCFLGIARPESTCNTCAHSAWSQGEGLRFVHVFPASPRIEGLCAHPDTPGLDDPARSLNLLGVGGRRLFELWLCSSPFCLLLGSHEVSPSWTQDHQDTKASADSSLPSQPTLNSATPKG